jgi:hypothetical protein
MQLSYPYPTADELQVIDEALSGIADAGRGLVPQWLGNVRQDQRNDSQAGAMAAQAAPPALRPRPATTRNA